MIFSNSNKMKKLFNHQFLMAASTMPCNQFIQKKFMVVVLMMALNSMSVLAATTYNIGNSTLTVNDDNTATLVLGSDFGDFYDWQISNIYGNWASITNLKVTGEATAAAITRLSNQPVANAKRLDYSEVTGVSFTSGINGGWRAVIFPSGTTLTDEMKSSNWDRKYAIVAGETLDVWVINNDGSWVNDVLVQNASSITIDGNSPFDKENDPNVLSLIESGKDVNGSGGGSGGNKVTITELSATSSGNAVATAIQSNLDEGNTIIGLEIGGTLSSDDITAIQNLGTANTVRTLDYSRVENNVNDLPILTSATTILLPGGVSYSNGSVTIGSSTTLNQLSAALKVLKDNGKTFSSVPLPGGSTYANGKLNISAADVSNLANVVKALKDAGLDVSEIEFAGGSKFSSGSLTIKTEEDDNLGAYADAIRSVNNLGTGYESFAITSVALKKSDTSWSSENGGTMYTYSDDEDTQNTEKTKFTSAGFAVSKVVVKEVDTEITHSGQIFYNIKVTSVGKLEAKLNAVPAGTERLYIEGPLNTTDLAALHDKLAAKGVKTLCMDMATVEGGQYEALDFSGNTVIENIILPNAMSAKDPTVFESGDLETDFPKGTDSNGNWMRKANVRMFQGCTSLNAAIAISKDGDGGEDEGTGSTVLAFVGTAGKLKAASDYIHRVSESQKIETVKLAGNLNNADQSEALLNDKDQSPKNIDLSRAVFQNSENLNVYHNAANWRDKILTLKLPEVQVHELGDSISNEAFFNCKNLTSIFIPENYRVIGEKAFAQCSELKQIDIGTEGNTQIELIGKQAFYQCPNVKYVYFGELVNELTFGEECFYEGKAMNHITIPEGTVAIGDRAFYDLENLAAVRLPETLKTIGNESFCQCHKIEQIVIPKNVESIGKAAFVQCTELKHIFLMTPPDKDLPRIWPAVNINSNNHDEGTFEGIQLFNAASGPEGLTETGSASTGQKTVSETWEEGCLKYKNAGCGATVLHFIQAEKEVDGKMVADTEKNDERFAVSISDTYYYQTSDDFTLPKHESISGTEYGDDYAKRLGAAFTTATVQGGSTGGKIVDGDKEGTAVDEYVQSAEGWKQFILMKGESPTNPTQILTKQYDDTWYTMCFPFDLTPGQLETAFGASYEICEFTGVEVVDESEKTKALILHFMDVAQQDTTSEIMAFAAHPYMIHPNTKIGANGKKTDCEFVNIKYLDYEPITAAQAKAAVPTSGGKATLTGEGTEHTVGEKTVTHYVTWEATKGFTTDAPGQTGYRRGTEAYSAGAGYTFVGMHKKDGEALIPYGAYFLGCERDKSDTGYLYPKYYRETAPDTRTSGGLWRQYTAIIIPNEAAVNNIENGIASSGAKGFDLGFNEYVTDIEYQSPTGMENILNDARDKGLSVEYMDVIYNINGQIVGKGSSQLKNLPKGLYIVNGKKYFVK